MVKIKLKTLANKTFDADLAPELTIGQVKVEISEKYGFGEPELIKLIYTGKILKDEVTVEQSNLQEGGFLVVMVSKKKEPVAAPSPPSPAPVQPAPLAQPAAQPSPVRVQPAAASPVAAPATDSGLVRGPAYDQAVENLMALGFEREQVVAALQASFNNPDRAAEYLFSGIPESFAAAENEPEEEHAEAAHGGGVPVDLATIQQLIQDRPEVLDAIINHIGQSNPQLLQAIGNNREAFAQLIQNPAVLAQILQSFGIAGASPGGGGAGGDGSNVVQVSLADRQAIERLAGLGFSHNRALEAYLACDRNEEIAANYLFESGNDPEPEE
uniref:UV excision repair protein RAD23 n=1 Tax=Spongospora subterranea TaxID=70186 RepID=A0A0H5RJV7_9EUKA|eukprot:CRZ09004.1 hypothetical protein [Spongospora subterranea]